MPELYPACALPINAIGFTFRTSEEASSSRRCRPVRATKLRSGPATQLQLSMLVQRPLSDTANGTESLPAPESPFRLADFPFEAGCLHRKEHPAVYSHYHIKSGLDRA